ncbi:Zn-dependent alcohol dehydrogenase [Agaribacterium sp. ZY112]|uniref:Zn-dependent alcohol dehydrogenase n=1 Tax=Agaribacterium sp. ZY112 TaxID=3233574 RepID=UPI003525C878
MRQSKALITDGQGHFEVRTIEVGDPGPGEVRVKLMASGICHTDWDSITNWNKTFVVGHEGAGIVDAVGEGVTRVAVGDKVILNWAIPCGECFQCLEGNPHICEVNSPVCGNDLCGHAHGAASKLEGEDVERSFHLGTMAQYTVVQQGAVVAMGETDLPMTSASIVGCGVITGWGSVVNAAEVKAGSTVAVIGCGGVGLNVIQGALHSGAARIIAIDLSEERLEQAQKFGATHGILATKGDNDFNKIGEKVAEINGGRRADYAFECTAVPALGSAPLALIRSAGTAVQVSGIEEKIDFDCELFEWDKIYINPLYGKCNPDRDFPRIVELYNSGKYMLDEMVTKTYTLETAAEGFDDMLKGRIAKGVIVIEHDD